MYGVNKGDSILRHIAFFISLALYFTLLPIVLSYSLGGKFYTEFYISGCVPSFPGFSESVGLGLSDSSRTFRAWAAARMAGLVLM